MDVDLRALPLGPRAGLAQHRELRAAARAGLGRAAARRWTIWRHGSAQLGALGRVDRAGARGRSPGSSGAAEPRSRSAARCPSCSAWSPRRCRTARGSSSRRSSSPRTCSRGWSSRTAASRSSRCRPTGCSTRSRRAPTVVAFSLVQSVDRRGRRLDDDRGRGPRGRRAGRGRRQPGRRLAAGRRQPGRRVRLRRRTSG